MIFEVQAFESLVAGNGTGEFCIIGAPVALAEFAQHLRYQSRAHWSGSEPMRWEGGNLCRWICLGVDDGDVGWVV